MKEGYRLLGDFIRQVDVRNTDGKEENLLGVSVQKMFIPSIANTVGTDFTKYKVVKRGQFTYIPDTSRRGDKIGIALLTDYDEGLVSNIYTVFEVKDENELLPEYLMLWFSRPEFDRYARFKSHGSVREIMDWDEMCKVELPVPSIEKQRSIVKAYNTITDRIELKRKINDNLEAVLAASHSKMFFSKDTSEHSKLGELMTFGNGKSRPKTDGPIPVYGGNGVLSYTDHHNIENAVLIGRVGAYCGSVYLEQGICWVSDNAIFAKSKITKDEFFDYFLLKRLNLFNHHVGTGQQLLTQEILNNIEVPKPVTEQIELFNRKATSIFETIFTNSREIIRLQELSDLLLSRLAG
ncbi:Type I restriction modification DNA specificity domain [Faecalibacterium prausnitzii]|jgi:restriction endonuclease S subunit|uniref:restriction endonuclease subunit S n=1 Tax=Flavonifractor plautii TaxID=292800 RepID=UPI0006C32E82|nr:restriction endonuclease subunit S [Flavonifractor plautii]MCG4655156.1 restriction endonuclease subunit S [Flavonifractor plautii]CUO10430.1 Type I restriction modification DNA specificity domain [Faecalibacterium prausnitzii]